MSEQQLFSLMGRVKRVHLIGIGGVGMCGIAEVLLAEGFAVSGSDIQAGATVERLRQLGAEIYIGHNPDAIQHANVVVVSTAITEHDPEVLAAKRHGIAVIPRAQMLGELMRFRYGISVTGTHGKTTTTSLIADVLLEADADPSFVIGGKLQRLGTHAYRGQGPYMVVEADESDASFLLLNSVISVVTNIDVDHMHTYGGDFAKLKQTFVDFLHQLPFYGLAVLCDDDPVIHSIYKTIQRPILRYGFADDVDYQIVDYRQIGVQSHFKVRRPERETLAVSLNLPGRHNVLNALAAIVIATELGLDDNAMQRALSQFSGVGRRFQSYGDISFQAGTAHLIDDYGHHPREIASTIIAIRDAWPEKRLVLAFQPHRYSRTEELFADFVDVLAQVDVLLLLDIYAAGEHSATNMSSAILADAIRTKHNHDKVYTLQQTPLQIKLDELISNQDVLLMQGAGNIGAMIQQLIATNKSKAA